MFRHDGEQRMTEGEECAIGGWRIWSEEGVCVCVLRGVLGKIKDSKSMGAEEAWEEAQWQCTCARVACGGKKRVGTIGLRKADENP